jgi:hypothetical protein
MLDSCNGGMATREGVACRSHGRPILIGDACRLWLLNDRMPLIFGVVHGHMKLWMPLFDPGPTEWW